MLKIVAIFLKIFSLKWIIASIKEVSSELFSWKEEEEHHDDDDIVDGSNGGNEDGIGENGDDEGQLLSVDQEVAEHKQIHDEMKGEVTYFSVPLMAFLDVYDNLVLNNSKRIYHKLQSNGDIFCGGDDIAASYLYDECMDKCNMKEMNQVACLLMLMINGRVKSDKEKKKNMLNLIKKFVNFCRYFNDEQCKGMSYPLNLLCLIYRKNDYLREHGLERSLLPLDAELKYLKKVIADIALEQCQDL